MADPFTAAATLGSAAIGAFSANASSRKQYKYQKKLMQQQAALNYEYAEKSARNTPTWNRAGLEDAGYNPMLAVQNATFGANSNWTSGGSVNAPDYSGAMESGVNSVMSYINAKNQTAQTESQVKTNEATAENQRAEAANKRAENPYISRREEANIGKIGAETSKLDAETDYNKAAIENMKARIELDRELGFAGIDAQYYSADKSYNATKYHADTLKDIADEHSPSGRSQSFRNYLEGISAPLHGIGSILHSGNGKYSESTIEQNYDKHGNIKGVKTKEKTRKRK